MGPKYLLGIISFQFFLTNQLQSQIPKIQWQHDYGGSSLDGVSTFLKTNDQKYLIVGFSFSKNGDIHDPKGDDDYFILKTDSKGNLEWSKNFGGSGSDAAYSGIENTDGSFIVVGGTSSEDKDVTYNHGNGDLWIIKLGATGNLIWQKSYGGSNSDVGYNILHSSDGGFTVAGASSSIDGDITNSHGAYDCWILKFDSNSNLQWQKTYGGSYNDKAYAIKQTPDKGYIIAASTGSTDGDVIGHHRIIEGTNRYDFWVFKIDSLGNMIWQNCLGGAQDEEPNDLKLTPDGGCIITGYTYSRTGNVRTNHGGEDTWVVKLDSLGNLQWQKTYGNDHNEFGSYIILASDHGYILAATNDGVGGEVSGGHGNQEVWLVKLDYRGKIVAEVSLGGSDYDRSPDVIENDDRSLTVVARSGSSDGDVQANKGDDDIWLFKLKGTGFDQYNTTKGNNDILKEKENTFITISPNPASSTFILFSNGTVTKMTVFDISGQLIEAFSSSESEIHFGGNYRSGIYFSELQFQNGIRQVIKIVKE